MQACTYPDHVRDVSLGQINNVEADKRPPVAHTPMWRGLVTQPLAILNESVAHYLFSLDYCNCLSFASTLVKNPGRVKLDPGKESNDPGIENERRLTLLRGKLTIQREL